MFSVNVNGNSFVTGLDIFAEVGCWTGHLITREVVADVSGVLTIDLIPIYNTPVVSFLEVGEKRTVAPYDVLYFIPAMINGVGVSYVNISSSAVYCRTDLPQGSSYQISIPYTADDIDCHRWSDGAPLAYTISGLSPGASHPVRIGFVENS